MIQFLFLVPLAYALLALWACLRHLARRKPDPLSSPPAVSILKPVRGADEGFKAAIDTHGRIRYPRFEIVFGMLHPDDPARPHIEQLQAEHPHLDIRIVHCPTTAANQKVGTLIDLAAAAKYDTLVLNDSDISVEPDYLTTITAELAQPDVSLVTCLYRASACTLPAKLEALGIATDFVPGALVAPTVGVREFGLGSTMALRREDLNRIGGFAAIADYVADDYQLAKRVGNVILSTAVVATHLDGSWTQVWNHQVRWARTIRLSRSGYYGLPVANTTLWVILALVMGFPLWATLLLAVRLVVGLAAGAAVLRDGLTLRLWWLMPVRDVLGFAVWIAGAVGSTVVWRGRTLKLNKYGRIS